MTAARDRERTVPRWAVIHAGLLAVVVTVHWLPFFGRSLWVDEALSWWLIDGDLDAVVSRFEWMRAWQWHPVYVLLLRGVAEVFGTSEIALRLPSFLASLGAAGFLFATGRELRDGETGALAALIFVTQETIRVNATHARPYGLALLMLCGAAWLVVRWVHRGGLGRGLGAASLMALLPHVHVTFVLAAPGLMAYVLLARRHEPSRLPVRHLVLAGVVVAAGALSYLPVLLDQATGDPFYIDWISTPPPGAPVLLWAWTHVVAALLIGLGATWLLGARTSRVTLERPQAVLLLAWGLLPALTAYAVTELSSLNLFFTRYIMAGIPGLSLLFAVMLRGLGPLGARLAAAIALVVISMATFDEWKDVRGHQDFRGAAEAYRELAAGEDVPLLYPSFIAEAMRPDWLRDRERSSYLVSALGYYDVGRPLVALPKPVSTRRYGSRELASRIRSEVAGHDRVMVVVLYDDGALDWIGSVLRAEGFVSRRTHRGAVLMDFHERE